VADRLAEAVGAQWRLENAHRKVHHPKPPLPVHWHPVAEPLVDHVSNIFRVRAGTNPGPLALAGHLEQIVEIYRRIPSGRLVVLGKAGSGKTVLTILLVLDLLDARTPTDPVPVIFSVGSWNPGTVTLAGWLTAQLTRDHPGLAPPGRSGAPLAAELLATSRVLPILDGFDEIADDLRLLALEALDATDGPLVLTSRSKEYADAVKAKGALTSAAAIELDDLALADLAGYLPRTTTGSTPIWEPVLDRLRNDPAAAVLRQVLTTPLMVFLARAIYSGPGGDPGEMIDDERFDTQQALADHLLATFVPAVYPRRPLDQGRGRLRRYWDPDRAQHWLRHLARHSDREGLKWWELGNTVPRQHRVLAFGLAVGLIGGIAGWVLFGLQFALVSGLVCAAVGGLFGWGKGFAPLVERRSV
jgi:hypothetical protein